MPEKSKARTSVEAAFREKGQKAAIAVGNKHDVKASRVIRWIKKLEARADPQAVPPKVPKEKKIKKEAPSIDAPVVDPLHRFDKSHRRLKFFKKAICKVLHEGPQQSEVKFLNGNVRIVVNEWLEPLPKERVQ